MKRILLILALSAALSGCDDAERKAELVGYDCAYGKIYSIGHTTYSCRQECSKMKTPGEKQACYDGVRDGEADKKGS